MRGYYLRENIPVSLQAALEVRNNVAVSSAAAWRVSCSEGEWALRTLRVAKCEHEGLRADGEAVSAALPS